MPQVSSASAPPRPNALIDLPRPSARGFPWRAALWTFVAAAGAAGGVYLADRLVLAPQREQARRLEELEKRRKELEGIVARLKHTVRRAQIVVLDQQTDAWGAPRTTFRFTEIDAEGNPVGRSRDLTVAGEEVYFDALVIKFEDRYVEAGEALRGKSLLLFRRVFTNRMKPEDGLALDARGSAPEVYAAREAPSAFERELWRRFWELSENPAQARAQGVRVLQGEAVYRRFQKDRVYLIEQRATGEVSISLPSALRP
jgi:hypothetical protein